MKNHSITTSFNKMKFAVLNEFIANIFAFMYTVLVCPLFIISYVILRIRFIAVNIFIDKHKLTKYDGADNVLATNLFTKGTQGDCNVINSVSYHDNCPTQQQVQDLLLNRVIIKFKKFRSCARLFGGYLLWQEDQNFNIDNHIKLYKGKSPTTENEIKSIVNGYCNVKMSVLKPLWEYIIIPIDISDDVMSNNVKSVCIFRIHHAMADGLSVSRLVCDEMAENKEQLHKCRKYFKTRKFPNKLIQFMFASLLTPRIHFEMQFRHTNRMFRSMKLSGNIIYDWSSSINLHMIKCIKNATSTTVNDVMSCGVAAGLQSYFSKKNINLPDFIRCCMAISFQSLDEPLQMQNKVAGIFVELATSEMKPIKRLKLTKKILDKHKGSADILASRWISENYTCLVPNHLLNFFSSSYKCDVAYTVIAGPPHRLNYSGLVVENTFGLPMLHGNCGIALCAYSYCDHVTIAAVVDQAIMKDRDEVQLLLRCITDQFQELYNTIFVKNSGGMFTV